MDIQELKDNLENILVSRSTILFVICIIAIVVAQICWSFVWEILAICLVVIGLVFCIGAIIMWFEDVDPG